jgi:hypothetical protein
LKNNEEPLMATLPYSSNRCVGTWRRRAFLQAGLAGWGGLALANLLRCESLAASPAGSKKKSMIVVWLWGGPSHMETFDLKPDAPLEYRGEFRPISTNVLGIEICEHLPLLARQADKFAIIRSCHHTSDGHVNSTHTMLTGYPGESIETPPFRPKHPDFWAIAQRRLAAQSSGMPFHVALPDTRYEGGAYLGSGVAPMKVPGDPNSNDFRVPNLSLSDVLRPRLSERLDLLRQFDRLRHQIDSSGLMDSLDSFNQKAVSLLSSAAAREAFDLAREDAGTRDRYGRHVVGQRCLLARRLVEAGVRMVTVDFPTVPGQKAFSWDDHASVWNIFEQMKIRLPVLDQVVSALIEDLDRRGLADDVLVAVLGEMSHTPRLSNFNGQPGREHWARSMSIFLAGGGLRTGQVVGSTTVKGDEPAERPLSPNEVLATWYHILGVPLETQFIDHFGRPVPILPHGSPIRELV